MDELNMRFPILQHTSERLLRNVAIVLIAGFGAGLTWGASILDYEQVARRTANVRFVKGGEKIKMES